MEAAYINIRNLTLSTLFYGLRPPMACARANFLWRSEPNRDFAVGTVQLTAPRK